jgi:hypothetical protein
MFTTVILVTICGLVIFLGFEIRHNEITEAIAKLKDNTSRMGEEIVRLNSQMKMKKDVFEEHKPSLLYPPGQSIK